MARYAIRSAALAEGRTEFVDEIATVTKCIALRFPTFDGKLLGYAVDEIESLILEELDEQDRPGRETG